jgi:superfamily II DNA or RNA helicase/HKD family nuclease
MQPGLYEKLLNYLTENELEELGKCDIRKIDHSETSKVLSLAYQKMIREILSAMKKDERVSFIDDLNEYLGSDRFSVDDSNFIELLAYHNDEDIIKYLSENRPRTSIANSTLFTGHSGPTLESELKREIRTADRIDFLISFVKYSGLRLILDDLEEFTKDHKLRVITTSYMGASDYKAIIRLSELSNTEVKVSYDNNRTRLHAKAYYFERKTGFGTAYIGSSNLSNAALSKGLEWNLKVSEYTSKDIVNSFKKTFESYWNDDEFVTFDPNSEDNRIELKKSLEYQKEDNVPSIFFNLKPYSHQKEILEDLRIEREEYNSYKNLIVSATGTGKTMIAAFDFKDYVKSNDGKKLLFLAHRKEILQQSIDTFRGVLKDWNFGDLWVDGNEPSQLNHVFASVQTLNSKSRYKKLTADHFDYIVIDESHHSSANSYLKILKYFEPEILLGLTATPERMDGENIKEYFNHRIASEIRLADAIDRKLLSPFHYFAVTDPESLKHLSWSRGGYEISQLENVYTKSKQRLEAIISSMKKYLNDLDEFKALGFCVSINHCNFMAESFNKVGIKSISLHSRSTKEERDSAKRKLQTGEINCIFTVDLFNEGVDIPDIDTVLFLRPTESLTIFIQQLGRGLRLSEDKEVLTVLDFVGQAHKNYDFSFKLRTLIGKTNRGIKDEINDEFPNMPAGCFIKLEKVAKDYILDNIQSSEFNINDLRRMVNNFGNIFTNELNLENFLENYGIEINQFYSRYSFYELLYQVGMKDKYLVKDTKGLNAALRRFSRINSKQLLNFAERILTEEIDIDILNKKEELMLGMLHYTIWGDKAEKSYKDSYERLMRDNVDIVEEILDIIDYNKKHIKTIEIPYEDKDIPLDIYASYTVDQIMVTFGKNKENYKYPMRQGVLYIEDKHTDLFFITINKNEENYLPSTMYNDYAISNELFHWESQSTTSVSSPTGQRYINDRSKEHKVLFFVRSLKHEYGNAAPYIFLGNGRYVSHEKENPIQIIWKMDHLIPEKIIKESNLRVVD